MNYQTEFEQDIDILFIVFYAESCFFKKIFTIENRKKRRCPRRDKKQ